MANISLRCFMDKKKLKDEHLKNNNINKDNIKSKFYFKKPLNYLISHGNNSQTKNMRILIEQLTRIFEIR